jgi:hypothetical protein
MGDRIKPVGSRIGNPPAAGRGKEVKKLKKYLVRLGYTLTSLAALLVVLGAGRKIPIGH